MPISRDVGSDYAGPPSTMMAQHYANIGSNSRVLETSFSWTYSDHKILQSEPSDSGRFEFVSLINHFVRNSLLQ